MIPRKTVGSGISGTVRYVLGEGKRDPVTGKVPELAPGEKSRVAWYGGTGFPFPLDSEKRLDLARRQMEWAAQRQASKTKLCTDDCLHLVLAWDPEEHPTRTDMEAAAHSVLKHLGMANARAIFAAHDDTDHAHLHLVISRIDPESGKAFPDHFDKLAMSDWALQWELEHGGIRCEARPDRQRRQAELDPEKVLAAFIGRRETFTAFDLNRELTRAIPSRDMRRQFITDVLARPEMIRLADPGSGQVMRYTTRQTLTAEHLAEASADRLFAARSHQVSAPALAAVLDELGAGGKALRADQLSALRHVTGAEGISIITGLAGTGKTFAMTAIAAAYAKEGYSVHALAPTNKVASALKRDGLDAATIHSAIGSLDKGKTAWNDRTVVMVDEAGMISTRLMARLLAHAEQAGAKVILVGDDRQLKSMDRGGMFGYLSERYGAGELNEITRQRGAEQRELGMRASRYDFVAALTGLEQQGGIVTVETAEARIAKAAELWGAQTAKVPKASLFVVAVSNADAAAANLAIRQIRRDCGELGPDHILSTADGPQSFAAGDRILFSGSAGSREGRAAGLVNGNAGTLTKIEGNRLSVALDGARPGEVVTFTVGKNREAGEVDTLRHGYAGTIYKAQGATYDRAIVIDSPNMRANAAYVALTRHRDGVSVVTARDMQPGFESWMAGQGGFAALTEAQQARAAKSYEKWRENHSEAARRHDFADYVAYVQGKEAERRVERQAKGGDIADLAKRWRRTDDRRAASRFEALDYTPPAVRKLTPAEVRAAVGIETFEQDHAQAEAAPPQPRIGVSAVSEPSVLSPSTPSVPPMPPTLVDIPAEARQAPAVPEPVQPAASATPMPDKAGTPPLPDLETLRQQAERESQRLQILREQEERAQAFRRAKEAEAEEARKAQDEQKAAEERRAEAGDIGSAEARYAIALGETYSIRDPYGSLARAAMSEYAMFHRAQEKMRAEIAGERDPDKRQVIELRRTIEACDYMAITSDRLAGISVAITGRSNAEQAVADWTQAAAYRDRAAALRTERGALIEAVRNRIEVVVEEGAPVYGSGAALDAQAGVAEGQSPSSLAGSALSAAPASTIAPELAASGPTQPMAAFELGPDEVAGSSGQIQSSEPIRQRSTADPSPGMIAEEIPQHAAPEAVDGEAVLLTPSSATVSVDPALSRPDVIPAPLASLVTRIKDAEAAPALAAGEQSTAPWLDALRRRVEEAEAAPSASGKEMSDNALARLARRLEGKSQDQDKDQSAGQGKEAPEIEPDL